MTSLTPHIAEVKHGSAEHGATVELRQRWLRDPLGLRFSDEELAGEDDSYHLACWLGTQLAGCAVLRPVDGRHIQMRQLVVRPEFRRRGLGTALVQHCESLAQRLGFSQIVLHARDTAVGFYERLGYHRTGGPFIAVTIPHWTMVKELSDEPGPLGN